MELLLFLELLFIIKLILKILKKEIFGESEKIV